jgi:hypothetical protein
MMFCRAIDNNYDESGSESSQRPRGYNQIRLRESASPFRGLGVHAQRLCTGQEYKRQKHRVVYWVFGQLCRADQ